MNLQLFGYDDGFYYGQCKLIFEAETVSDNGKTVTISDGTTSKSGIVVDKKCEFLVPGRSLWIATLLDGSDAIWTGKVEAGYGECKHIMLADGYEAVMERDVLSLEEINAATDLDGYIPNAEAIKDAIDGMQIRINNDAPEWRKLGADTWNPFLTDRDFTLVVRLTTVLQYTTYQYQTWISVSGSADYTIKRKDGVTTISGGGPAMTATLGPEQQIPGHNPNASSSLSIISFTWD